MNTRRMLHLAVIGHSFVWLPALAQNTLTVTTELARVSNPELAAVDRGSVTLIRTSPLYTIRREQADTLTEFAFGGTIERSSNTDLSANRELPRASVLWQKSSPLSVLELRASLEEASTRETEFSDFGRVTLDSTERTGILGTRWTRDLTPASNLELSASHRQVDFDTPLLVDYSETQGSAVYEFEPSDAVRYSVTAALARLNPDGTGASASRTGLGLGYEREINEQLRLNATAGVVRVTLPVRDTHAVGGLRLGYTGERATWSLSWTRDVSASGTVGGYERSQSFDASMSYPLTAATTLSLGAGRIRSLEADRDEGSTAFVRVRSSLTQFWAWTAGLESRRAKPLGGPTAKSNTAFVGLVYENPDF